MGLFMSSMRPKLYMSNSLHKITFWALPMLLFCGWINHVFWIIGMGNRIVPVILILVIIFVSIYELKDHKWELENSRWLIAPVLTIMIVLYLPWWNFASSEHTDAYYHILEAMNFAGFVDWAPSHQGLDFLFRPPLIPGVYAMELSLSDTGWVTYTPLLLVVATLWQLQHLAELWATKTRAALVVPVFLLLPSVRYWGQLQLLDVPVSGMFILVIHLLILSNENIKCKYSTLKLGMCAGLIFLTKYVFIYAVAIGIWLAIKDRAWDRTRWFYVGWFLITSPFLIYHFIKFGDPLKALTPQSSFAINGITQNLGTYNYKKWLGGYNLEISGIGILASLIGLSILFYRNKSHFVSVLVMALPFVIIHAFVLDFGTVRYQIPFFALTMVFIVISMPIENKIRTADFEKLRTLLNVFGITSIIFLSMVHLSTIDEEKSSYSVLVPEMDKRMQFYLNSSEMFPDDEYTLTSKYIPIGLHTGKNTAGYTYTSDPLTDSLNSSDINYALTSNYYPYRDWEKNFKPLFGNHYVEPVNYYQDEDGISILWKKEYDSWLNFSMNFDTNGTAFGNMLELNSSEYAHFEENQTLFWIKLNGEEKIEDLIQHYLQRNLENELMSCDFISKSGFCNHEFGELINYNEHEIYIWILAE